VKAEYGLMRRLGMNGKSLDKRGEVGVGKRS
jgi:hypothetical protein